MWPNRVLVVNPTKETYNNTGQLKTAKGWEADTTTARLQEQFGYAYVAAWPGGME